MCSRVAVVCVISALLTAVCSAEHSAAAPAVDCSSLVLNMADCLTFVAVGSTKKKPEGTCCSGLKTVLKTDADCLCEAFSNSAQLGVTLNLTLAMSLPKACHLATPPSVSNCGMRIGTGAAPAEAPVPVPPISVTGAPTAVNGGNEVYPVPAISTKSGVSSLAAPILLLLVAAASFPFFCAFISR